jgi:uncharacterized protein
MTKTSLMPDANVWVALTFDSHPHHASAKSWFDGLSDEPILFCRMTQQVFLRLATNPSVGGPDTLTLPGARQAYDTYLADPRIAFAAEPATIEQHWRGFTQGGAFSPNAWNDAYLAAFAISGGYQFVTDDKGFARYPGLSLTLLP